ncbi:MAG: hypothetical protein Q4Q58_03575 [Thermoplasmata archaeon]|nr:hypothetical protein [Thermoplasmata archaeon]
MRKFGKESAAPSEKGADRDNSGNGWLRSHWCALALGIIVIVAFLLRFVFAYGISADGDFALSGGSSAQYHLHVVESLLNGSYSFTDASVNYPVGGSLYIPPLMDFLAAGMASVLQGSMGTATAASFSLAVLNPILGALACIPVYLIGREMFDKTTGVVAALVFAFLALPISTSVFSSGNEYALATFLLAFMAYFAVKMVKKADAEDASRKGVLVYGALTGIFLMLAALTWNGFRIAVVLLVVAMVLQAVVSRVRGKDFTDITLGYAVAILIGTLVPAAYYVPAGLMDMVYSGPLVIAVVSVVFVLAFLALREKPWVTTIPALVIAFIVLCIVLAVAVPDLLNDFLFGNSLYSNSIMNALASSRVSLSEVASYYGWLTMWLPFCVALYEAYVYLRRDRSCTRLFVIVFMFLFIAAWTSYSNAAVIGAVFAVGSAAAIVTVIRAADLRDWVDNIKSAGFPGCFRKLVKPLPFVSVLVVALLVILPNASFAIDAGESTNQDSDAFYSGNTTYTIKTGDSYPLENVWAYYEDQDKTGAIAAWIDYSYDAVNQAGFDSVADTLGNGATAVANMYLSDGSEGTIATMILRIMMSDTSVNYASSFTDSSVYQVIRSYIDDPSLALEAIESDPETYGSLRSDLNDEAAVYLAGVEYITSNMDLTAIMETYSNVCSASGESISYVLMDGSMLALYYGDSDIFSTIAYFAGYSVDSYGAATQYYSYNTYYGYTTYTDAMYETFLWKSLIGLSADDAGYSSAYSYLSALALSDGSDDSAKAIPGYGLTGFTVETWYVLYNPDSEATSSSDGWVYMDGWEAQEKQATDGGVINYLAGIVTLKYTGTTGTSSTVSMTIEDSNGNAVDGATVTVYQYDATNDLYVPYSKTTVSSNGVYRVITPAADSGDFYTEVSIGDVVLYSYANDVPTSVTIIDSTAEGEVQVGDVLYDKEVMSLQLTGDADSATISITDGTFSLSLLPGTYSYTLTGADGTSLGTGTVTLYPGAMSGLVITPTTYTITVTVNDIYGNTITDDSVMTTPVVYATDTETGAQFSAEVGDEGTAVITVIPGTYTISMGNGLTTITSTTHTVSSSNRTATVTAYTSETVTISNGSSIPSGTVLTVSAGTFSTTAYVVGNTLAFDYPVGLATDDVYYSIYGVSGSTMYYGVYTGGAVSLSSSAYIIVSGQVLSGSDGEEGTVIFMSSTLDGFQISYVTDSDGNYTAIIPNTGDFIIYAHNGSDMVYFGEFTGTTSTEDYDISLVDGRRLTQYFRYDSSTSDGNENIPFASVTATFTYNETTYTLYTMTNTSGVAYFYIPDSIEATVSINGGTLDNEYFYCTDMNWSVTSGTSSTSDTEIIRYYGYSEDQANYVKTVGYVAPFDFTYVFYDDDDAEEVSVSAGQVVNLCPGQYTITVDGSTGYYFSGTAYIYPGAEGFTDFDYVEVIQVVTTTGSNDSITITTEDGSYYSYSGGYYFVVGYTYEVKSTNTSGDTTLVQYAYLDFTEKILDSMSLNMTAVDAEIEVTGYVGVVADGTITVTYTNSLSDEVVWTFDVTDGAYTLTLPASATRADVSVSVSATVDSVEYWFSGTAEFTGLADGVTRNVSVLSSDAPESEETEEADFEVEVTGAEFSSGTARVTYTIKNNTSVATTYLISSGTAWTLNEATSETVAANSTGSFTVYGIYDATKVAPGLDDVTLIVTDINGGTTVTEEITSNSASHSGSAGMTITTASTGGSNDKVSGSEYLYAVTFVNSDVYSKDISINVSGSTTGWYVTVMDADGTYVGALGDTITIYGLQSVTYYIALMQVGVESGASSATVPSLTATVSGDQSATLSLTPTTVDVDTSDGTVDGGDAIDSRSGMPAGIWFLVAVILLMVIAIFWLASKRGVFSRR